MRLSRVENVDGLFAQRFSLSCFDAIDYPAGVDNHGAFANSILCHEEVRAGTNYHAIGLSWHALLIVTAVLKSSALERVL